MIIRPALFISVLLAVGSVASAHDEVLCGSDGAGKLKVRIDTILPLLLDQELAEFPGISGFPVGLTTPTADEPVESFYALPPTADIVYVLIDTGHGLTMYEGFIPMTPGYQYTLGNPYFHFHPVWAIEDHHAGETIPLTGYFRDLSGQFADSDPFEITFTTVPPVCEGDFSGDLELDFVDITAVLSNWGNPFDFASITAVLSNWGADCHPHP